MFARLATYRLFRTLKFTLRFVRVLDPGEGTVDQYKLAVLCSVTQVTIGVCVCSINVLHV